MELNSEKLLLRGVLVAWALVAVFVTVFGGWLLSPLLVLITIWLYRGGLIQLLEFFGVTMASERDFDEREPNPPEDYTDLIHRLYDGVWNRENPDVADDLVAADYYIHDREIAKEMRGPELYQQLAAGTEEIFPDMELTIHETVAADEKVAVRWTMSGTHEGAGFGMEPTGETVEFDAIEINRFENGKLRETWTQSDQLGMLQQIGAIQTG